MMKSNMCDNCKMAEHFIKIGKKQGRLDAVDECITSLEKQVFEYVDEYVVKECAEVLKKLKEKKNEI